MEIQSRLKECREARGYSAAGLAAKVGVSRQTIYAIEDGSFVPNTSVALRMARVLETKVEDLFLLAPEQPARLSRRAELLAADGSEIAEGGLVRLFEVGQRTVAAPASAVPAFLPVADGIVESTSKGAVTVRPAGELPGAENRILLAGCDPALSLAAEFSAGNDARIVPFPCPSRQALDWLQQGKVHAAGAHILDRKTGEYNVPYINRTFQNGAVRVVTFASWQQGFVVARGNPKRIESFGDLGRREVTIINREKGSGSRDLLDNGLEKAGIVPQKVSGYSRIARGHLAAALAIEAGEADCCIATQSAARCFALHFIPLATERFDIAISKFALDLPGTRNLLDTLNRSALRRKLEALAGYDARHTGEVLV